MRTPIPKHRCQVFDYGVEENGGLYVRCRVCARSVLWCDLPRVGGGLRFTFLSNDDISASAVADRSAMYLTPDEAEKAR